MLKKIIEKKAKMMTLFIYSKQKRKLKRALLVRKLRTAFYGRQILKTAKEIGKDFACNNFSTVNSNTIIRNHVNFNGMTVIGGGSCFLGNYFHSGSECLILTENHNYEGDLIPYDSTNNTKDVIIDDCVWLGSKVTILPGTHIGEGAIIQAGAVVHGDIPRCAIVGGNPAKVFKYRNIEHFDKLKAEGKFHTTETILKQRETFAAAERE